ncbi:MAG: UDP-N-acetylmuramate dehydrogenase [Candidatus Delongbacteria bacterium]|jgi:UDP-N-acetylmuramate dehydrogenase|nr:UDP-N-acetylmuramate dehydrogenase [Candidatus Delongbacteria bacterium]
MISKIKNIIAAEDLKVNELLSNHTSYKIGGPAKFYVYPKNKEQLIGLLEILKEENVSYFILGKGSNLIVSDNGFKGCIIDLTKYFSEMKIENGLMTVGAGALLTTIAFTAIKNSLSGMEELAGIPGTLGGALLMNAGCYGNNISNLVESVSFLNTENKIEELSIDQLKFGYRTSNLKGNIIIEAKLRLVKGDQTQIKEKTEDFLSKRRESQPLDFPSCGSVFKRPIGNYAGKLIEDAGLKGKSIGGVEVSEKHSGFIVNKGNATARDLKELIELIKYTVSEKFNVMLQEEVIYLG